MFKTSLYWFNNDLRVSDNLALQQAALRSRSLICIYCVEPHWFAPNRYVGQGIGQARWRFMRETLAELERALAKLGQRLLLVYGDALTSLVHLIRQYSVDAVFRSNHSGFYENQYWLLLQQRFPSVSYQQFHTHTLFRPDELPFALADLPSIFSQFRLQVEDRPVRPPLGAVSELPSPPTDMILDTQVLPSMIPADTNPFVGGELFGLQHLEDYFAGDLPAHYKMTRDQLDGWQNSSKLSPWLANGSISARQVFAAIKNYERRQTANHSTYWLYFELLWREYFHWYAYKNQQKLFFFRGIKQQKPLTSFYPERFQKWCNGETPYALVNACMKQLNHTGFMSNRGRQIVASCLVNELDLDWRYGAAYFEQHLLDYDVAVNWGNWQYLAGVGADPRGKRHFDIEKQTEYYDPERKFIRKWQGEVKLANLDSCDYNGWPVC